MKILKTGIHHLLKKYCSILRLSFKRFYTEKRILWATSLTYTTIFSLIPLLSVLFFLFNTFGDLSELKTFIQPYIYKTLAPGAQEKVINIIDNLVNNINFSTVGALGSTVLIISVFLLLFEIEYALNEIWLIKHKMSVISRAAIYWTTLTIGPLVLAVSLFIIATLHSYKAAKIVETYINPDVFFGLSYILIWLAFTGIYYLMPDTRVKLKSALFGGIIAGTIWKIAGFGFTLYASNFFFYYPRVFGSLAAIPMFLLWLFLCWILFLLGAEMTYVHQNYPYYGNELKSVNLSTRDKEDISIMILFFIAKKFLNEQQPPSLSNIAGSLKIPFNLIEEIISPLLKHGILIETSGHDKCFVPGRPLSKIKLSEVLEKIHTDTTISENYRNLCDDETCKEILRSLNSGARSLYLDKSIKEILGEQPV